MVNPKQYIYNHSATSCCGWPFVVAAAVCLKQISNDNKGWVHPKFWIGSLSTQSHADVNLVCPQNISGASQAKQLCCILLNKRSRWELVLKCKKHMASYRLFCGLLMRLSWWQNFYFWVALSFKCTFGICVNMEFDSITFLIINSIARLLVILLIIYEYWYFWYWYN